MIPLWLLNCANQIASRKQLLTKRFVMNPTHSKRAVRPAMLQRRSNPNHDNLRMNKENPSTKLLPLSVGICKELSPRQIQRVYELRRGCYLSSTRKGKSSVKCTMISSLARRYNQAVGKSTWFNNNFSFHWLELDGYSLFLNWENTFVVEASPFE